MKYIYGPAIDGVDKVLKKSEMEVDTNPRSSWLIGFTRGRLNTNYEKENKMLYNTIWGTKRMLHEEINVAWVDVNTPEGELMKHTFDVNTFPHIILVIPGGGYYEMPWISEGAGWTSHDVSVWVDTEDYTNYDRNEIRPAVGATTLFVEYVIDEVARNHLITIFDHLRAANKMLETHTGSKWNFKDGYSHFGKKNKYRKQ